MAEQIRRVREQRDLGNGTRTSEIIDERDPAEERTYGQNMATQIVWFITSVLLTILLLRFFLALFGANPGNPFASFIYTISYPFVAPFFTLFNYNYQYGVSRFESYTLVAMVIYSLLAYGITRLINLNRPVNTATY